MADWTMIPFGFCTLGFTLALSSKDPRQLFGGDTLDCIESMEIVYYVCMDRSSELSLNAS